MKVVKEFENGSRLYVEDNEVGGRRYLSDSVGGGVTVWDTAIVSEDELFAAIQYEQELNGL